MGCSHMQSISCNILSIFVHTNLIQLVHLSPIANADFPPHDDQLCIGSIAKLLLLIKDDCSTVAVYERNELLVVQLIDKCLHLIVSPVVKLVLD